MNCIVPMCKNKAILMGAIYGFYNTNLYYCNEHKEVYERVQLEFDKIKEAKKNGTRYKFERLHRT